MRPVTEWMAQSDIGSPSARETAISHAYLANPAMTRGEVERVVDQQSGMRFGDWMQVRSGKKFWPMDPRAAEVDIADIAHSLSMQCRYAGHCLRFYSVAEHSVLISRWLRQNGHDGALHGLLHDAPEAYLVDVPRPVKPFLVGYKDAESKVWGAVAESQGISRIIPAIVHEADNRILADERAQNMAPTDDDWGLPEGLGVWLEFWTPERARAEFLAEYWLLIERGV
jgi:uncharacterized protein